jgi:hypothetical protein
MSSHACIVYVGVCYEIRSTDTKFLEDRSDPRLHAARRAGLKYFWANFGAPGERYLLFIGTELGIFGPENRMEFQIPSEKLREIFDTTSVKLKAAGISSEPFLVVQWLPDA